MANTYQLTQTGPQVQADLDAVEAGDIVYLTSAPSADNTSGKLKIVVLEEEPSTKYEGYIYIVKSSSSSPTVSGGTVSVTVDVDGDYFQNVKIYDGTDDTGTLLQTVIDGATVSVSCSTGHLYIIADGIIRSVSATSLTGGVSASSITTSGDDLVLDVSANGSVTIEVVTAQGGGSN